ncbi:MAG TPA: rhomboid family intramembrane serine protease, partial [Polyangiaceae bacterium]
MWKMYGEVPAALANQPVLRLQMASYTGLPDEVDELLRRHFPSAKATRRDTARAIAMMVADQPGEAERILQQQQELSGSFAIHAAWRRAHPLPAVALAGLSSTAQTRIADFRRDVAAASQLVITHEGSEPRAWATIGLIGSMVVVFALGLPGGAMDPENLVRLGALILPSELAEGGLWWRLVAAGFLHLGSTHLLMNCLGLWVLGKQIEELWNGLSMLSIFLVSSIGSFAFAATFVTATERDPRIFLGASSGVMGLVGALGAYLAVGYWLHRRPTVGRRLLIVVAIVAAQLVFDWFTPIVSSMLHMTGLLIGACVGVPLAMRSWRGSSPR